MKSTAVSVVRDFLNIKPSEKVLILTDKKMLRIGRMLYKASKQINLKTILFVMESTSRDGEELSEQIVDLMKKNDVVIAVMYNSISHTKARKKATDAGVRVASMPRIKKFSFTDGGLTANYYEIQKLVEIMFNSLKGSSIVEVISKNGTEIKMNVQGRLWQKDTGIIHNRGEFGNLPGGEVFIAPLEKTVFGKIVFDHFALGRGKIKIIVENGKVKEIMGRSKKLKKIFNQFGEKAKQIAEFGIGCNPKAKVIGNILEDEKVLGTVHFALGNNIFFGGKNNVAFHLDGIIEKPTVNIDNKTVIKNGRWLNL